MFTSVRWLNRSTCLKRFYDLLPEIKTLVEGKKEVPKFGNKDWIADLVLMIDITTHFSPLNRSLKKQ